jgi:hypothetical protein
MHFSPLVLPLAFFSLVFTKVGRYVCCVLKCFCVVRFWSLDHRVQFFFLYLYIFPHLFSLSFFFPFYFFLLSLLSCCLASLLCFATSKPWRVTSSGYFPTLLCLVLPWAIASNGCFATLLCLVLPWAVASSPCPTTSTCYFVVLLCHMLLKLLHCLELPDIALLPSCLALPCCLAAIAP